MTRWLTCLALALAAAAPRSAGEASARMRGVCWEASGPIERRHLEPLREVGADWIAQTPFGWVPSLGSPEIRFGPDAGMWGETDAGLVATAAWAHELGIKTLLKPHLWVRRGEWSGDIAMADDAAWARWFAAYEAFIVHYAELAEAHGFEALAVGTELGTSTRRTADWRRIIARVRRVYHGRLTYCANWNDEAERIEFWGDLDFIGIQAYYPLSTERSPARTTLAASWARIAAGLESLARRTKRRVVFTEIGYKSCAGALAEPWRWNADGDAKPELQSDAYATMFEALWDKPWFGGTFVWKWHPSAAAAARHDRDFTPQGKPALAVIRTYYAAPR